MSEKCKVCGGQGMGLDIEENCQHCKGTGTEPEHNLCLTCKEYIGNCNTHHAIMAECPLYKPEQVERKQPETIDDIWRKYEQIVGDYGQECICIDNWNKMKQDLDKFYRDKYIKIVDEEIKSYSPIAYIENTEHIVLKKLKQKIEEGR